MLIDTPHTFTVDLSDILFDHIRTRFSRYQILYQILENCTQPVSRLVNFSILILTQRQLLKTNAIHVHVHTHTE